MSEPVSFMRTPEAALRRQIEAILTAWGMRREIVEAAVEGLAYADMMGIDSHGVAMLPIYRKWLDEGRFNRDATPRVTRETAVSALIDGDLAMGFLPATQGMRLAIAKAKSAGIGMVAVRRSNHYGAAGFYAGMAAREGLIGIAMTNTHAASVVPTRARAARLGTNPIAFAAPAPGRPFLFDMATSTVALGKLMVAAYRGKPIPEGWALDAEGRPTTDPAVGYATRMATPLGGMPILSSHKGYGLGAVVEILSAVLPAAAVVPLTAAGLRDGTKADIGHFLLAFDVGLFRDRGEFEREMGETIAALRATPPVDASAPVLVAGDPEYAQLEERQRLGVPLPTTLVAALRQLADACNARWEIG